MANTATSGLGIAAGSRSREATLWRHPTDARTGAAEMKRAAAGKQSHRSAEPRFNERHRARFRRFRTILVRRARAEADPGVKRRRITFKEPHAEQGRHRDHCRGPRRPTDAMRRRACHRTLAVGDDGGHTVSRACAAGEGQRSTTHHPRTATGAAPRTGRAVRARRSWYVTACGSFRRTSLPSSGRPCQPGVGTVPTLHPRRDQRCNEPSSGNLKRHKRLSRYADSRATLHDMLQRELAQRLRSTAPRPACQWRRDGTLRCSAAH